ncbi:MAG: MotA/TolQ/ExbB proton channel family protein [Planctomycetota bacterium]
MNRLLSNSALALAALTLLPAQLTAQEAQTIEKPSFMTDVIENAGLIGWLIVALSVLAVALAIESFMTVKREKLAPPHLIDEIEALLDEEKWQEAVEVCEAEPCYLTDIVGAGLSKLGHSFETIQLSYDELHEERDIQLNSKIGWLSLIAAVAPMMGLLGTVNGMITTFGEIAVKPSVKPNDLAAGIKGALVTTLLGLTVAIPVTACFVFFKNRVTMLSLEVGAIVEELFERFRPKNA